MSEKWIREGAAFGLKGKMMANANEWLRHKAFVEAAKRGVLRYRAAREAAPDISFDDELLYASTLIPKLEPKPAPTLAEQGEEIKAGIDGLTETELHRKHKSNKIKAMVDAIVAAGEAK